jgi:hypothetical protein
MLVNREREKGGGVLWRKKRHVDNKAIEGRGWRIRKTLWSVV